MGYVQYLVHTAVAVVIISDLVVRVRILVGDLELGGGDVHAGAAEAEGSLEVIGDSGDAGRLHQTKVFHYQLKLNS